MFYTSVYDKSITDKSDTNKKPILTKSPQKTLKGISDTKIFKKKC